MGRSNADKDSKKILKNIQLVKHVQLVLCYYVLCYYVSLNVIKLYSGFAEIKKYEKN